MQNSRKHSFIQNKREINSRKYKIQETLDLGCTGNRLERSQHDFKWKGDKFAKFSDFTFQRQI